MQVQVTGYIYHCNLRSGKESPFVFFNTATMEDRWYSLVGPAEFTYEVPEEFDPTRAELAKLEREAAAVRAAFQARMAEINERVSKLQALTNEVPA